MKVLVTGGTGQLGRALIPQLEHRGHEVVAPGRDALDLSRPQEAEDYVAQAAPDRVIHGGAYTQVDQAESEPELAMTINRDGTAAVARGCVRASASLVYVSTDYVFSGPRDRPWTPEDAPEPCQVYGRSKRAGETAALETSPTTTVVRTSWVIGEPETGGGFLGTILRLAGERERLQVISDQVGAPTFTVPLAEGLTALAERCPPGVWHMTGAGEASWHDLATAAIAGARRRGADLKVTQVEAISSSQWVAAATRPAYSVLDTTATDALLGHGLPPWRDSLETWLDSWMQGERS